MATREMAASPPPDGRSLSAYPVALRDEIERYLVGLSFSKDPMVVGLDEAMRYSLLAGGKRLRPVLVLATARALQLDHRAVLPLAAAIELIHTYSLIHDDLPAMDDDDLRRGRPTSHRVFGEGIAILAGDALQSEAFRLLLLELDARPERVLAVASLLARAIGPHGLCGGQYVDLRNSAEDERGVLHMHRLKTGSLLSACVRSVLELALPDRRVATGLKLYGNDLGLMFQLVDDMLDVNGTSAVTGKSEGSDARNRRRTMVADGQTAHAAALADELAARIAARLADLPLDGAELLGIAQMVRHRNA